MKKGSKTGEKENDLEGHMYKKICILISFLLLTSFLSAEEFNQADRNLIPVSGLDRGTIILPYTEGINTNVQYEFIKQPTTIMNSYYDYMPGGFNGRTIRKQTGYENGTYLTWFGTADSNATRLQYYAYRDASGTIGGNWGTITAGDVNQGYGTCAIHPASGNCIASWNENPSGSQYGCTICYDDYSLLGIPGFWSSVSFFSSMTPDEYIWPRLYTGISPNGDGWTRVYHISQNIANCNDVRIMFIDIEGYYGSCDEILNTSNWTCIFPMQLWIDKSCRARSLSFSVDESTPGKVSMIGYCTWMEGDLGNMPVNQGLFVWESYDYGETWDYANLYNHNQGTSSAFYQVENLPQFEFNGFIPDYLDVDIFGYNNTALYNIHGDLHATLLTCYSYTDPETRNTFYVENFHPQIDAYWLSDEKEFVFNEIPRLPGTDTQSYHSVPWEITGNDTVLYVVVAYPGNKYSDKQSNAISTYSVPFIHCWSDATYSTLAHLGYSNYSDYLEHPVICIGARGVWGGYKLLELTDINNPNFDFSDQITVYPYLEQNIVSDYSDLWGKVLLYYYDDNSFGSHVLGFGDNSGGNINYCEVDIYFYFWDVEEEPGFPNIKTVNFPNPFNSYTTISFSSKKPIHAPSVTIYNARGQLINILESQNGNSPTEGFAVWDGTDLHGNNASNGIYFYKVNIDGSSQINKMLLSR